MAETIAAWLSNPVYQENRSRILPALQVAADQYGVPVELLDYTAGVESRWGAASGLDQPSAAGELGIFQQTPAFRQDYGVTDPLDINQQADAAARALQRFYEQSGDWGDTLIGYNRGLGGLRHYISNERDLSTQPEISARYRRGYDEFLQALNEQTGRAPTNSIMSYSTPVRRTLQDMELNPVPTEAPAGLMPISNWGAETFGYGSPGNGLEFSPSARRDPANVGSIEAALRRIDNA